MKKILFIFVTFCIFFSLINVHNLSAIESDGNVITVEDYEKYLENYSISDAKEAGVSSEYRLSAVKGAKDILDEFSKKSYSDKQEFVQGLVKENFNDLEFTQDVELPTLSTMAKAKSSDKNISYSAELNSGLAKYRVSVKYRVTSGKVNKILASDYYVVNNYNPLLQTGKNSKSAWVTTDNKAAVQGSFYYRMGAVGVEIQLGTVFLKAVGDKNGKRTYNRIWAER